jgi:hypothetical protein
MPRPDGQPPYDHAGCERFVAGLGPTVRARALVLFELLDRDGDVEAQPLALALGLPRAQLLPGALNTHLKRRAAALGWPLPFAGGTSHEARGTPPRTWWADRDGIAGRMRAALADAS